ncbi:hypothetical protein D3C87_1003470 [compost metagenome]
MTRIGRIITRIPSPPLEGWLKAGVVYLQLILIKDTPLAPLKRGIAHSFSFNPDIRVKLRPKTLWRKQIWT